METPGRTSEERRRIVELVAMVVISVVLVLLARLEGNLFQLSERLSEHKEFFNSVVYFGLINLNVVLILFLSFLIFRNVIKLVIERKRGVIGSRLRTKLVVSLVFFALAPTALLFYVSQRFLTESFETWFSSRVEATIARTKEASALIYKREERRLESLARIALQRVDVEQQGPFFLPDQTRLIPSRLEGFDAEYRLNSVKLFDVTGRLIWSSAGLSAEALAEDSRSAFIATTIERFLENPGMTSRGAIKVEEGRDVVKGAAPFVDPASGVLLGVVLTEERFETQIIRSVEAILKEFSSLRPGAQLIRVSYTVLLVVMVLIIVFSATWLGFYVAKGIIGPIQSLAEATRAVAVGNYDVILKAYGDDEASQLVRSFNRMTRDLRANRSQVKQFTAELEAKNVELDGRRKNMEVVLKNISAGVISLDAEGKITAVNDAAERLLALGPGAKDQAVLEVMSDELFKVFWSPIARELDEHGVYNSQIELEGPEGSLTLLVDGNKIFDENKEELGCVVVFADASEQVKAQRVAAWREVARRIAHEIKNPITPIKLSAQRLLRRFAKQFEGENRKVFETCIATIVSEVDNLRDLVNEFSKFSRLPTIKPKKESLNDLIYEVHSLYSMSYPHIKFDLSSLQDDLPLVSIDKEHMSRAISNLVANAEAAIGPNRQDGEIKIRTSVLKEVATVRVEIIDNGSGVPDKLKSRVLEPYFSTKKEGTGLGLAIVNQIVSDHGGYLRIADNHPQGANFIIELPLLGGEDEEPIRRTTRRS